MEYKKCLHCNFSFRGPTILYTAAGREIIASIIFQLKIKITWS
jgi:hypothetical protein